MVFRFYETTLDITNQLIKIQRIFFFFFIFDIDH